MILSLLLYERKTDEFRMRLMFNRIYRVGIYLHPPESTLKFKRKLGVVKYRKACVEKELIAKYYYYNGYYFIFKSSFCRIYKIKSLNIFDLWKFKFAFVFKYERIYLFFFLGLISDINELQEFFFILLNEIIIIL